MSNFVLGDKVSAGIVNKVKPTFRSHISVWDLSHRPTIGSGLKITESMQTPPYHGLTACGNFEGRFSFQGYLLCLSLISLHCHLDFFKLSITVETLYNTIDFCSSTHKRHSIARPKGRAMGCLLWVQRATYCVDLSKLSSIKYLL